LNWSGGPNNGTTVNVRCHDAAGAAQDATFGLTYLTDELPVFPLPAPGGPDRAKAFVWSDVTGSNLNPSAAYSFNSGGGTNTVTQLEPGIYRVDFPDIGTAGGIVHVNAYDSDAYCKAHSWGPNGTTQEVYVLCFGPSGAAVSSRFSVLFYKEDRPNATFNAAYTRSLIPITTEPVVPPTAYSWNGRRLANGVSRTGVGRYRVTFTGVVESPNRGSAIATAYGPMPTRCKVVGWIAPLVDVFCHQIDGTPIDSEFGLSYFTDVAFGADTLANGHPGAFVFADQPASASYDPGGGYRFNSLGGTFAASRSAAGSYAIDFGLHKGSNKTMPIITAHGTTPAELDVQCHQDGWTGVAAGARILVACYNAAGVPDDYGYRQ
jgi:hypothetical protein